MSSTPNRPIPSVRIRSWAFVWVVLLALSTLIFLHHRETGWNVNTRLALVISIVEFHTFSIDGLHDSPEYYTMDKAYFQESFYSDKIFGVSLLALPFYWLFFHVGGLFGWVPSAGQINYLLTLVAVKFPAALSVGLLWRIGCQYGLSPRLSAGVALGCFVGSLWHGYASIFMPYAPGIAACLAALYLLLFPMGERITPFISILIGLFTGFALLCDLIFVIAVFLIGMLFLLRISWEHGWFSKALQGECNPEPALRPTLWCVPTVIAAGLVFPALFMAYSTAIFGTPTIPYQYEYLEEFRVNMAQGIMGVKTPRLSVIYYLTIHPFRGLFFWSPWIVLALYGGVQALASRNQRRRSAGGLVVFGFIGYLLFNSGYYMWWGGFGMGPRLMLPAFVFLPLGLFVFLQQPTNLRVGLVVAALCVSIGANFPVSILEPQIPVGGNSSELLYAVQIGDSVQVPQFVYWRGFFILLWETLKANPDVNRVLAARFIATLVFSVVCVFGVIFSTREPEFKN
ncbi:MAG: hypothetical protein ACFCU1_08045 [Sumerlaeia bacterium]